MILPYLWFDEDGQAVPNPITTGSEGSYLYDKATQSIRLYHLNHADIVERRLELFREITKDLESADKYFLKVQRGNMTAQSAFEDKLASLSKRARGESENSAAARAMLAGLRTKHPVADEILRAT